MNSAAIHQPTISVADDYRYKHFTTSLLFRDLRFRNEATEAIVSRGRTETPNLMLIRQRTNRGVGKVSEMKKGLTEKIG